MICTCRLFSSTAIPGQTRSSNSALLTTRWRRSTSAFKTSKARDPIFAGWPSISNCRRAGWIANRPKRRSTIVSMWTDLEGARTDGRPAFNNELTAPLGRLSSGEVPAIQNVSGLFMRFLMPIHDGRHVRVAALLVADRSRLR